MDICMDGLMTLSDLSDIWVVVGAVEAAPRREVRGAKTFMMKM